MQNGGAFFRATSAPHRTSVAGTIIPAKVNARLPLCAPLQMPSIAGFANTPPFAAFVARSTSSGGFPNPKSSWGLSRSSTDFGQPIISTSSSGIPSNANLNASVQSNDTSELPNNADSFSRGSTVRFATPGLADDKAEEFSRTSTSVGEIRLVNGRLWTVGDDEEGARSADNLIGDGRASQSKVATTAATRTGNGDPGDDGRPSQSKVATTAATRTGNGDPGTRYLPRQDDGTTTMEEHGRHVAISEDEGKVSSSRIADLNRDLQELNDSTARNHELLIARLEEIEHMLTTVMQNQKEYLLADEMRQIVDALVEDRKAAQETLLEQHKVVEKLLGENKALKEKLREPQNRTSENSVSTAPIDATTVQAIVEDVLCSIKPRLTKIETSTDRLWSEFGGVEKRIDSTHPHLANEELSARVVRLEAALFNKMLNSDSSKSRTTVTDGKQESKRSSRYNVKRSTGKLHVNSNGIRESIMKARESRGQDSRDSQMSEEGVDIRRTPSGHFALERAPAGDERTRNTVNIRYSASLSANPRK
eukprot:GEMP01033309.1.p1 GENE.GEMP01033309.1~~GEMP01033309.1.p1  ORF type:complete len:535 (+),score=117.09 GEMP01033309.1:159-1763(+)